MRQPYRHNHSMMHLKLPMLNMSSKLLMHTRLMAVRLITHIPTHPIVRFLKPMTLGTKHIRHPWPMHTLMRQGIHTGTRGWILNTNMGLLELVLAPHILRYMTLNQGQSWVSADMGMQLASRVCSQIHQLLPCPLHTCTVPWRQVQAIAIAKYTTVGKKPLP